MCRGFLKNLFSNNSILKAPIAQLAEQIPLKNKVTGSTPVGGTQLILNYKHYVKNKQKNKNNRRI